MVNTNEIERYLHDILGISIKIKPWMKTTSLPNFLREMYDFMQMEISGQNYLLFVSKLKNSLTPANIKKQKELLALKTGLVPVYVDGIISTFDRKRLIGYKVPFVIPGNQMYLPMLGMDLREYFRKPQRKTRRFSPAAQVVALLVLKQWKKVLRASEVSKITGYSLMTVSRVFGEFESSELGKRKVDGRNRNFLISLNGKDFWRAALPNFDTPVKRIIRIPPGQQDQGMYKSGLTALSCYSNLAEPSQPVYAVGPDRGKNLITRLKKMFVQESEQDRMIEIWTYAPEILAENGIVDKRSLYLNLRAMNDERVASALTRILEEY